MQEDKYLDISLNRHHLHLYVIRSAILKALKGALPLLHGKILDIGCGQMPYREYVLTQSKVREYVGLDIENAKIYNMAVRPDFIWNGARMPFDDQSFDCAIGTEVLEHCPHPEITLKEVYRVLKPDGVFFFTVPFLWNLHEVPHDEYRYTPFSLARYLTAAGFRDIIIKPTGGWHAAMALMLGLWVKRAPIPRLQRLLLSFVLLPIMRILLKKDASQITEFTEKTMIVGLSGTVKK